MKVIPANNSRHTHLARNVKYKDLAIAIALSSASLLLVPTMAKADSTTASGSSTTSETVDPVTTKTETASTTDTTKPLVTTSAAGSDSTTTPATTVSPSSTTSSSSATDASAPETPSTTPTPAGSASSTSDSSTTTTSPAISTGTASSPAPATGATSSSPVASSPAGSAESPSTSSPGSATAPTSPATPAAPATSTSSSTPAATSPSTTSTGSTTTPATNDSCTISACPVDVDGNPLGDAVVLGTFDNDSTATIDWSPDLIAKVLANIPNSSQYTLWDPSSVSGTETIKIGSDDVTIPVTFALKTATTTYTFVDETTGKTIYTQTDTWDLANNPSGSFEADGLRPAMAVMDSAGLTTDDQSTSPQTDTSDLPYFGPDGDIFDDGYYLLDSAKSGNTTPLAYVTWPASGSINKTFYYTEASMPSVTIDAVDDSGNTLKTFSSTTFGASLPASEVNAASYLPSTSGIDIPGYTLAGVTMTGSNSRSGQADKTLTYTGSDANYADFLATTEGSGTYDVRTFFSDYATVAIHFEYKPDLVNLMVQPVDSTGADIGEPIPDGSGFVGETEEIPAPTVRGFAPVLASEDEKITPDGMIILKYVPVAASSTTGSSTSSTSGSSGSSSSGSGSSSSGPSSSESTASSTASAPSTVKAAPTKAKTVALAASKSAAPISTTSVSPAGHSALISTREAYQTGKASPTYTTGSYSPSKIATETRLSSGGILPASEKSASAFPQTGNQVSRALTALGLTLMATLGLCYKKIKKMI